MHAWEIETEDGEKHTGEDDFPSEELRNRTRVFRLALPGCPTVFRTLVPTGASLIAFMSVEIVFDAEMREVRRNRSYTLGFKLGGAKVVQVVSRFTDPETRAVYFVVEPKDDDGRPD